jgi:precorrin-2 dehydrogenase/sirohydrochlorin ferrochelatase
VRYYPALVDLTGKKVVVIGGGKVGERKVGPLLSAGASVTVVAPEMSARIAQWVEEGKITCRLRSYQPEDIEDDAFMVMVATDDHPLNARIAEAVSGRACLVNVADIPAKSSFIVPSMVVRGDLVLAISTGGAVPALARKLRQDLERQFGEEYEILLNVLREVRESLKDKVTRAERRRILRRLIDSDLLHLIRSRAYGEIPERVKTVAGLEVFHWSPPPGREA